MHSSSNACLINAGVSIARFSQIFAKFDAVSLMDPFRNRIRPHKHLQINGRKNQQVYPAAQNFIHRLPRYASIIISYCITLLQLLYRWQHMSRKLWISRLLRLYFLPDFHEWIPKNVFSFGDRPNVISNLYTFELLWNALHIWDIHRAQRLFYFIQKTAILGINKRVNDILRITVRMKTTSQATNFIKYIWF
jgi:hypothetical protein